MRIDPSSISTNMDTQPKTQDYSNKPKKLSNGRKLLAPIGVTYRIINQKTVMEAYLICLEDYEDNNEESVIHIETFWLTEKALWRVANMAVSLGWTQAFDCENKEQMEKIFLKGEAFVGVIEVYERNGYENAQIKYFNKAERNSNGEVNFTDSHRKLISHGETIFPKFVSTRQSWGITFVNPIKNESVDFEQELEEDLPF